MNKQEQRPPDKYKRWRLAIILFITVVSLSPTLTTTALQNPTKADLRAPNNQSTCYKPQAVTSDIDGYVEGFFNAAPRFMNGKEVVYNFATFQRKDFASKMDVGTATHNGGSYVATIDGFVTNQAASTDYTQFRAQYEFFGAQIEINNTSLAANAPIWSAWTNLPGRKGTVHFATAPNQNPMPIPISGDEAFLELDRNVTFTPGVNGRVAYFSGKGGEKSYIVNCLVDINALVNDIRSGDGSPVRFSVSVAAWRDAAANAAQAAAQDYNNRVLSGS